MNKKYTLQKKYIKNYIILKKLEYCNDIIYYNYID